MTGKRKCHSAPEQRIKTASSSSSSNSVTGPQVIINHEETSSSSFVNEVEKCARILRDTDGMPNATFKKAREDLREVYMRVHFVEMSWEQRLEWLKERTPPEMEEAFKEWRKAFSIPQ